MITGLFALSLFAALVWMILRAVHMLMGSEAPDDARVHHADPIMAYVEENYGSHVPEDPISSPRERLKI